MGELSDWKMTKSRGLLSPKSYVDVPADPWQFDFLYTNFSPNYPLSILFLIEKHQILSKSDAIYNNLLPKFIEFGLLRQW